MTWRYFSQSESFSNLKSSFNPQYKSHEYILWSSNVLQSLHGGAGVLVLIRGSMSVDSSMLPNQRRCSKEGVTQSGGGTTEEDGGCCCTPLVFAPVTHRSRVLSPAAWDWSGLVKRTRLSAHQQGKSLLPLGAKPLQLKRRIVRGF